MKLKVLFVCIHNSARSQMAEALLRSFCDSEFEADSAGLEPGVLNPFAVKAMAEIGIDISSQRPKSVGELVERSERFDFVIAVCDPTVADRCPTFPGAHKLVWSFPDPSAASGTDGQKLSATREIRNQIQIAVESFCEERCKSAIQHG